MKKAKVWFVLLLAIGLMAVCLAEVFAKSDTEEEPTVSIRKTEEEVVLYTIHRGSYGETGQVIGDLYALAGNKGISLIGPACYVYLNNPTQVSSQHWLTEIRIPVSEDALKVSGTLGSMTDIKMLPAMEVAVTVKPEGQASSGCVCRHLQNWIIKQGYMPAGSSREVFLTNFTNDDYSMMKTEISIPIRRLSVDPD